MPTIAMSNLSSSLREGDSGSLKHNSLVLVGTKLDRVSAEAAAKKMQDIEHRIEDHNQLVQKNLSLRLDRMRNFQEWRLVDEDLSEEERWT